MLHANFRITWPHGSVETWSKAVGINFFGLCVSKKHRPILKTHSEGGKTADMNWISFGFVVVFYLLTGNGLVDKSDGPNQGPVTLPSPATTDAGSMVDPWG